MGYNDDLATHVPASQGPRVDGSKIEHEANEATKEPASGTGPWDGNGNDAKKISVDPQNDSGPVTQTKPPALPAAPPSTMPHSTMPTTSQMAPNTTHKLPENQGGVVIGYIVLPTDLTQYREMRKPLEEFEAKEQTGARNAGAISTVPYGVQYPSNDQKKSAEPPKPNNGSQYPSTEPNMSGAPVKTNDGSQYPSSDPKKSTQPNKPGNGNHYPSDESNEANKPNNGIQYPYDDPNISTNPKKPRNGSQTSVESNKQNNQQSPTVTTPEMNPKKVIATTATPGLAQSKPTHGNTSTAGAGVTAQSGSNKCDCSIL